MAIDIDQVVNELLSINGEKAVEDACNGIRKMLRTKLNRRGLVVAISGGIDSSVSAALAVKAVGKKRVFGLLLPEKDSSSNSVTRGKLLAEHLGIEYLVHDIAPTLESIGCYQWRDDAIKNTVPEYGEGWKSKITIQGGIDGQVNHFSLVVENPRGDLSQKRLTLKDYLQIVAATNYKQRIRKTIEYFHADRLNYAVVGTPNRMEYDQGFFVKNGDGSADLKPIAHLYKTQVYQLARDMGLPEEICSAIPTTDTYSLSQGQDEFYYALPYKEMDIALWCLNQGKPASYLASTLGIIEEKASYIYSDIENKRKTTAMLHWQAITLEKINGPISSHNAWD